MSSEVGNDTKIEYSGSCHCHAVEYSIKTAPLESSKLIECNCSICAINGYLFVYIAPDDFSLTKGNEELLTKYKFNTEKLVHHFCKVCGSGVFTLSESEEYYPGWRGVNARTIHDIDVSKLERDHVDGKAR